jgi:ABC-type multidrug transport system fused ATPase/permease subunit
MIKRILENKNTLELIRNRIYSHKKGLLLIISLIIFVTVLNVFIPYLLGYLTNILQSNTLIPYCEITFIAFIILSKVILQFFLSYRTNYLAEAIGIELKNKLTSKLVDQGVIFKKYSNGDLIQRILHEVGFVQSKIILGTIYFLKDVFFFTVLIINIISLNVYIFIALILFLIMYVLFYKFFTILVKKNNRNIQVILGEITNYFIEILNGYIDIYIYSIEPKVKTRFNSIFDNLNDQYKTQSKLNAYNDFFIELFIYLFITSLITIILLTDDDLSKIVVILSFIFTLLWPIKDIGKFITSLSGIIPSLNRIEEFLITSLSHNENIVSKKNSFIIEKAENNQLSVINLSFRYINNEHYILDKLNLNFYNGIHLISGENGAGKSTLLKIIAGIHCPYNGKIKIITNEKHYSYKDRIILVQQDPFLFNDTSWNNLFIDKSTYTSEEVVTKFNINSFLGNIINKRVGNNGTSISGGEKQMISIFRALIKNPDVLLLDEITNNLSPENIKKIMTLIEKLRSNKITILVSHENIDYINFSSRTEI